MFFIYVYIFFFLSSELSMRRFLPILAAASVVISGRGKVRGGVGELKRVMMCRRVWGYVCCQSLGALGRYVHAHGCVYEGICPAFHLGLCESRNNRQVRARGC